MIDRAVGRTLRVAVRQPRMHNPCTPSNGACAFDRSINYAAYCLVHVNHARTFNSTLCFVVVPSVSPFLLFPFLHSSCAPSSFCYYRLRCIRLFVFVPSILRHIHVRETYPHDRRDSHCIRCIFIVPWSHGPGISTGI